jgi:hypothetical protein
LGLTATRYTSPLRATVQAPLLPASGRRLWRACCVVVQQGSGVLGAACGRTRPGSAVAGAGCPLTSPARPPLDRPPTLSLTMNPQLAPPLPLPQAPSPPWAFGWPQSWPASPSLPACCCRPPSSSPQVVGHTSVFLRVI